VKDCGLESSGFFGSFFWLLLEELKGTSLIHGRFFPMLFGANC